MNDQNNIKNTRFRTYIGHGVVTARPSDAEAYHLCVTLHSLKNLFQSWDGNVLQQHKQSLLPHSAHAQKCINPYGN